MHVRLSSSHAALLESVATVLREAGHTVTAAPDTETECAVHYRRDLPLAEVTGLVDRLKPLLPTVQPRDGLGDVDVAVKLGDPKPLSSWEVKVFADSEPLSERLRATLNQLGFRDDGTFVTDVDADTMKYGGISSFGRQVVRFLLARMGVVCEESKDWSDDDDDLWIYLRDPAMVGLAAKDRYVVELHGDDYERLAELEVRVRAAGFRQVVLRTLDAAKLQFSVDTGPIGGKDGAAASELHGLVAAFVAEQGVDGARFPTEVRSELKGHARVDLPLGAWRAGSLHPYAGAFPERWEVVVRTDDPVAAGPLLEGFAESGFRARTEPFPNPLGFSVRFGAAKGFPEVLDFVRGFVEVTMADLPLRDGYVLSLADTLPDDSPRIVVDFPAGAASRSPFADLLATAARGFDLSLKTPAPDEVTALQAALRGLPWKAVEVEVESEATPEIQYGGAPLALVRHVQDLVRTHTGMELPLSKDWGDGDDDVWIRLPRPSAKLVDGDDAPLDLADWLGSSDQAPTGGFVEVGDDTVRIGPISLRRREGRHDLVPKVELFEHYCLDARTAESLLHVAEGVLLREPVLLEGETSVSKTSIVLYAAMLLNQPVVRLNLNGQTDTGELVGRYVPQDVAATLPVDPAELHAAKDLLEEESRMILDRAAAQNRVLTRVEVQQIMANERMTVHPWRWQDGLIVTAMKRGWWVVLDELNLAEPQILERLNPVLELHPSLVLTEHDNSVVGPGGHPVHPEFRLFATMNPAEYAGRSALSPAYRDRWRGYRYVSAPGEAEYLAMLRFLVYGQQPELTVEGDRYAGATGPAPVGVLADVEGIDEFLRALARFHAALEEAVGRRSGTRGGQLGARRRDRYVFSRRGLLAVVEYLAASAQAAAGGGAVRAMRKALVRYYLGRVQPGADQRVVARLLDAAGIGPATWAPDRIDAAADDAGPAAGPAGGEE